MRRQLSSLLAFALVLALLATSPAAARVMTFDSAPEAALDTPAAILRSAFYLRGRGRGLDQATTPFATEERQLHIQRHFGLVLATLVDNGERSLELALNRLEASRGESWTAADREAWRQTLAHRRLVNMRRLRLYQLRGQFPQNEHRADRAVPIFVDNHDTACAVGHLMRECGWGDAVAAIQRTNNFVYVTDIRHGPLVDWVLVSGLTQEEAALIQPAYYPSVLIEANLAGLTSGGSLTQNGLVYNNFRFLAGELTDPNSFPETPPAMNEANLSYFGIGAREGTFMGNGRTFVPTYHDWTFLGINIAAVGEIDFALPRTTEPWGILFTFDVMPVNSNDRIIAAAIDQPQGWSWNFRGPAGRIETKTRVYPAGASMPLLAELNMSGGSFGQDYATFAPQQKVTVSAAVRLEGESLFGSLFQSFQLVPEPTSASLASFGGLLALTLRRRRSTRTSRASTAGSFPPKS